MLKLSLVAGLAAAALIPTMASAQSSCEQQRGNQVAATVAGAGIGALLGSAIAGRGDHTTGAVVGGLGGAIVGNQISRSNADCAHAYGYYDRNSQWHANAVARADATGYYDRDGAWVEGAPSGYYRDGSWVRATTGGDASGYTDSHGRWVPASANGYYDSNGAWVTTASGYYDGRGRWVAGQTAGAYDAQGRWMPGARSGHIDSNGVWVADAQSGYYDSDHRWRAGPASGYYDTRGVWIATSPGGGYASGASYDRNGRSAGEPRDLAAREDRLEQRIRSAAADGSLSRYNARQDLGDLRSIRSQEANLRYHHGQLSQQDEAYLETRLDHLVDSLRASMNDARPGL